MVDEAASFLEKASPDIGGIALQMADAGLNVPVVARKKDCMEIYRGLCTCCSGSSCILVCTPFQGSTGQVL